MAAGTLAPIQRGLNGWPLFWVCVLPMSVLMVRELSRLDMSEPADLSHMIQYAVRWAVPFIFAVTAAPAMPVLFPGAFTRWWLRNRRPLGLVFAAAMGWQALFIFQVSTLHADYYYDEIYYLRDELEGSSGYILLAAMVATSFRPGRRLLSQGQWKTLHRCGVYFLWAYAYSVYWWNVFHYGNRALVDYLFYAAGFLAFAARIAAWGKRRSSAGRSRQAAAYRLAGFALIALGIIAAVTGGLWQPGLSAFVTSADWSATLELWLPFWPFEPFLPLLTLGIGTLVLTGGLDPEHRPQPADAPHARETRAGRGSTATTTLAGSASP